METILTTMLASAFFLSSLLSGGAIVQPDTSNDTTQTLFTKYLLQEKEHDEISKQDEERDVEQEETQESVKRATPIVSEPVLVTPTVPNTPVVAETSAPTVTTFTFDAIYQEAGSKYGIPWQILYGLHITETGGRDGMIMNGSGSGARGPMQFMPGTWNAYGVDGNGDGAVDIDNAIDAIHGAANFLAKHGSLANGLASYGGNTAGVLRLAQERGYTQ